MTDPLVTSIAMAQIKQDEGFSSHIYCCTGGAWSIGYGRNVDPDKGGPGITEAEALLMLGNDVAACEADLIRLFPGWDSFTKNRKATLINLRFQLGPSRLRGFTDMIACIRAGDWNGAARELRDSAMWRDKYTKGRTERRARELEVG